ncbi:hypothetical protein PHJA_000292700 [Phtheirospermum japonicum]|uniref:Uncharacterized protein n=1 Tax=Phtheirospermum japonicum TaxID=374723 RepID=A0A830B9R0_9LAMI|nr:hypothetical protein PHJA_000292700 [Phtheirospermum japonicum]
MSLSIIVFPRVLLNRYWCIASLKTIILDITHSCMAKRGCFLSAQYRTQLCSHANFIGMA